MSPLSAREPQFAPKAKRVIHIFLNGGPSHVDTFDPKPKLDEYAGKMLPTPNLRTERPTGAALVAEAGPMPPCYIDGTMRGANPAKGAIKPA